MKSYLATHIVLMTQYELAEALRETFSLPAGRIGTTLPLEPLLLLANDKCEAAGLGWQIDRPYGVYHGKIYRLEEFGRTGSGHYVQEWRWEGNASFSQTLARLLLFAHSNGAFERPKRLEIVRGDPQVAMLKAPLRE